ncbi:Zn-dependent protease with chaperone function [Kitasatospora sp. MAP12-15]|uniref:M48 family metallopeptidase n=1 Tax=unclassified Kitasatospora TaxID=2633591 RepID=UPI0024771D51|nr:M48 family metallopeptidase [Kitasatospora sp. MAP12-44]MDH6115599.1 Zn-dependent protease with chaperone function [Kitasatospora sp. MAP12-44]
MTVTASTRSCPDCAAPIDADPRFVDWCPDCEWNLGASEPRGRWRRYRRTRDRARVERLYAGLLGAPTGQRRWSLAWIGALVLAAFVHAWTLAIVVGSAWLLLKGYLVLKLAGATGLGLAYLLRPRFGRWKADALALPRAGAPQLYALADRIADELGTRRPDRIRVNGGYNASYGRLGVRRRVQLTVGMPLWTALTPQERIALLGHELGHGSNGDVRRGLWLGLALNSLAELHQVLMPHRGDAWRVRSARTRMMDELVTFLLQICALPVRLCWTVLNRLTQLSSQQAEYLADEMAARVGSASAAGAMLDKLSLAEVATARLRQRRAAGGHHGLAKAGDVEEELWTGLREYLDSVPAGERERRRRLSDREMTAVDVSHPPTHLRVRLHAERPQQPAAVTAQSVQWAAIETELEPARRRVAREILGH